MIIDSIVSALFVFVDDTLSNQQLKSKIEEIKICYLYITLYQMPDKTTILPHVFCIHKISKTVLMTMYGVGDAGQYQIHTYAYGYGFYSGIWAGMGQMIGGNVEMKGKRM